MDGPLFARPNKNILLLIYQTIVHNTGQELHKCNNSIEQPQNDHFYHSYISNHNDFSL